MDSELNFLKQNLRTKPTRHATKLIRLIVGVQNLKKMTATGRKGTGTEAIPRDVKKAVYCKLTYIFFYNAIDLIS